MQRILINFKKGGGRGVLSIDVCLKLSELLPLELAFQWNWLFKFIASEIESGFNDIWAYLVAQW